MKRIIIAFAFSGFISAAVAQPAPYNPGIGNSLASPNERALAGAGQLPGTATNDSAASGYVGEYLTGTATPSLSNGVAASAGSVALTPGDWDIFCAVQYTGGSTTVVNYIQTGINTSTAIPSFAAGNRTDFSGNGQTIYSNTGTTQSINVGPYRVSLSSTTTYTCVAQSGFTVSTSSATGFIYARRRR